MTTLMQAYSTHLRSLFTDDQAFMTYLSLPLEEKIMTMAQAYTSTGNGYPRLRWVALLALQSLTLSHLQDEGISVALTQEQHDVLKVSAMGDIWRCVTLRKSDHSPGNEEVWISLIGDEEAFVPTWHVARASYNSATEEWFVTYLNEDRIRDAGFNDWTHFKDLVLPILNGEERWKPVNLALHRPKVPFILTDPWAGKGFRIPFHGPALPDLDGTARETLQVILKEYNVYSYTLKPEWEDEDGILWLGRVYDAPYQVRQIRVGTVTFDRDRKYYVFTRVDDGRFTELGFPNEQIFRDVLLDEVFVPEGQTCLNEFSGKPPAGYQFTGQFIVSRSLLEDLAV